MSGFTYGNPCVITHTFSSHDFGNGAGADSLKPPKGFSRGRLIDIGINTITEAFANDATDAKVRVGTAADPDAYGELNISDGTATTDTFNTQDDTDAIINADIPAGTQVEVAYVAGTDGTAAAGIAVPYVVIAWW